MSKKVRSATPRSSIPKSAREVARVINGWAFVDIPEDAAKVKLTAKRRLPASVKSIAALLNKSHANLITENDTGDELQRETFDGDFDPTTYCSYYDEEADSDAVRQTVQKYFSGRKVEVVRGTGLYTGPFEFGFDWIVSLEASRGLIFSFIFNLQD
jgi:cell division protein YceG involved in septum cleavage